LLACLLIERAFSPLLSFSPLKLAQGVHQGRCSSHLVTYQCFHPTPHPLPVCCTTTPVH
jgi:hypothetical protein